MSESIPEDLFFTHAETVRDVLKSAVRDALRKHKQAGNKVATLVDGKVTLVPPEDLLEEEG